MPEKLAGDISFFLAFFVISVAFGMVVGRFRLVNVLINVYIAIAILTVVPSNILAIHNSSAFIIFILAITALTLVDSHLFDIHISGSGGKFFWRLFMMSFFEMGLIFSVLVSFWQKKTVLKYVSNSTYDYFASSNAQIFWMIIPLAFLFFINKKQK